MPWLMPVALVPFFAGTRLASPWLRVAGASLIASAWASPIAAGLVLRAPIVGLGLAGGTAAVFATCLVLAARPRLDGWKQLAFFAAVWPSLAIVLDFFGSHARPWPLSAALAMAYPGTWSIIALAGWPLLDAMLIGAVAVVWGAAVGRIAWRTIGGVTIAAALIVTVSMYARAGVSSVGSAFIGLVQGNLESSMLRGVGVSPNDRAIVRGRLNAATDRALALGAKLVVWPENGIGLPVGQIPSLAIPLVERARERDAHVLALGDEVSPDARRPAAWLLGDAGVTVTHKASACSVSRPQGTAEIRPSYAPRVASSAC